MSCLHDSCSQNSCSRSTDSQNSFPRSIASQSLLSHSTDSQGSCPRSADSQSSCPRSIDSRNQMPTDLNTPSCDGGLSTERILSTIPRADSQTAWLYPSPQMFLNAMRRKGHQPHPDDMDVIVNIHNMVNEQTWQEVLRWERYYHPGGEPKLKRFLGRPDKMSPRAMFKTWILGYSKPFDRHDWYVEREGREVRYVIDFYSGNGKGASFHIDARPAIDDLPAVYERLDCFANKIFDRTMQGISSFLNKSRENDSKNQ